MSHYWKAFVLVVCLWASSAKLFAQTDICSTLPYVGGPGSGSPGEVIVEQMKQRAATQELQEHQRASWISKLIPVKNNLPNTTLQALCIFHAEVVPQPALRIISVRAPQELMSAIEDAVKRLDVPQAGPKSVELIVQILVASDQNETMLRTVPASLKAVVDQLKAILPYKQYYLLDTQIGTAVDSRNISLSGDVVGLRSKPDEITQYRFDTTVRIGNGDTLASTVRLSGLNYRFPTAQIGIATDLDIPIGKQVVVGKASSGDRAFILVVSATIMN